MDSTTEEQAGEHGVAQEAGELRGPREVETEVDAKEVVRRLGEGGSIAPEQVDDATEWFLSDEEELETDYFELNVGTPDSPRWIGWTIRAVDTDVLKRIRRQGENRASRRRGVQAGLADIDPQEANARIVLEGTVTPDLYEVARAKQIAPGAADPSIGAMQVLKHRFRHKPGLLDQIAGRIMDLSGYNEDDVREAEAAKN